MKKNSNKKIIPGLLVVLVLLLLIVGGILNLRAKEKRELELIKLSKAEKIYNELNNIMMRDDRKDLQVLLEELHGSPVGYVKQNALFMSGMISFFDLDYENSALFFSTLVKKFPKGYLRSVATLNTARSYEETGELELARVFLKKLSKDNKNLLWAEATIRLAHLLEDNSIDEAIALYTKMMIELEEDDIWRKVAENRLIFMGVL